MPIIPVPIETDEQLLIALFITPLLAFVFVLIVNIFFFGKGIFTQVNIILIILSVILLIGYILGRRYLKNRK